MSRLSNSRPSATAKAPLIAAAAASALTLCCVSAPTAGAQADSSGSSLDSLSSDGPAVWPDSPPAKTAQPAYTTPDGTVVQVMGDVLGPYSAHTQFRSGDLGMMAPLSNGTDEFAMIFGDSFRYSFGKGEWMSPVGVVARMDENGFIEILRPLNPGKRAQQMVSYYHRNNERTLLPSDVINIRGTLYMQAMWNEGLHNVTSTQIYKSTNNGKSWQPVASTSHSYLNGMGDLITWEKGQDGYIYVMSTAFTRKEGVYLSRFKPEDIGNRDLWDLYDPSTQSWGGDKAHPILWDVQAGEINLRYIDGYWVLVMFNQKTLAVEVRVSETIDGDWSSIKPATIAKNGSWVLPQTPLNWSQPYGGYIVPGSTLDNMDIVVSQWNTSTNQRYMSTQFNVKGLDTFYGVERRPVPKEEVIIIEETPVTDTPDMQAENSLISELSSRSSDGEGSSEGERTAAIVLGVLAGVGLIGFVTAPMLKPILPPEIAKFIP